MADAAMQFDQLAPSVQDAQQLLPQNARATASHTALAFLSMEAGRQLPSANGGQSLLQHS